MKFPLLQSLFKIRFVLLAGILAACVSSSTIADAVVVRPDLTIRGISVSSVSVNTHASITVTDTTRNGGFAAAAKSTTRYFRSLNNSKGASDVKLSDRVVPRLNKRKQSRKGVSVPLGNTPAGMYYIIACADATHKVREKSEKNNCRATGGRITVNAVPTSIVATPGLAHLALPVPNVDNADFTPLTVFGTSQEFTIASRDSLNNNIGDATMTSAFDYGVFGVCVANICTPNQSGEHSVDVTYNTLMTSIPVTVDALDTSYSMTCQGANYDVDAALDNGCEQEPPVVVDNTSKVMSYVMSSVDDCAGQANLSRTVYSDARTHTNPIVANFDTTVGSAPAWFRLHVSDSLMCDMAYTISVNTTGGSAVQDCYRLEFSWHVDEDSRIGSEIMDMTGSDTAFVSDTWSGAGDDSADVYFGITKACSEVTNEAVTISINYEL